MAQVSRPLLAAAFISFASCAFPAAAQSGGVIFGCVHNASQQVRIVGATDGCAKNESLLTWNIRPASHPVCTAGACA